jgi:hypothetical protein
MAELKATQLRGTQDLVAEKGPAGSIKSLVATVVPGATASGTTLNFGYIPSNARILYNSVVMSDDLTTTGAATLDIGLGPVDGNITADPDAFLAGLDVTGAVAATSLIADIANTGKQAWQFVNGQTSDPGGQLKVYGSIVDAAVAGVTDGDVTIEVLYYVD